MGIFTDSLSLCFFLVTMRFVQFPTKAAGPLNELRSNLSVGSCRAELNSMRKQHWRTAAGYGRARAKMPRNSALFTDCPIRRHLNCGELNKPHSHKRQLRCKRVSRPRARGTSSHGLWHVAGAAPLRFAAAMTRAPIPINLHEKVAPVDSNDKFGTI